MKTTMLTKPKTPKPFDDDRFLSGLVRVVALDGSVWWVRPADVAMYAALVRAFVYDSR